MIQTDAQLKHRIETGELVEAIDTDGGKTRHEAAYIHMPHGASLAAISICGEAFGVTDGWVRGFGDPASVTCPNCLRQRRLEEREAAR